MFCKSCGNEIKEGIKFCTKCGHEVHDSQTPLVKTSKKFFTKKRLIVFFGIVLFLGILATFFLLYGKNKQPAIDQRNLDIASTVVNIYCTGKTEEDSSGGSGTIMTEDGYLIHQQELLMKYIQPTQL